MQTKIAPRAVTLRYELADGAATTMHVVQYPKRYFKPRLVVFDEPTRLEEWCQSNDADEAINGGYFNRATGLFLGEMIVEGIPHKSEPFGAKWQKLRGSLHISADGQLTLGARHALPSDSKGSIMQAGPALVQHGKRLYNTLDCDPEGFRQTAIEHDEDINCKRFPRAAIASDDEFIWTVTADGRSSHDAGLFLHELADFIHRLGATHAINLDGGKSASHIHAGELKNTPRSDDGHLPGGFPIFSAIHFAPIDTVAGVST